MNGIVNIYKEKGFTSHDVVSIVKRLTKHKAGHTGTLDPDAEGVLPVCIGRATKISDYIMAENKEYIADVMLGIATDTQDSTGETLIQKPFLGDLSKIDSVIQSFIGQITQIPPMYSALKIDGKKLYEYAREGKEIERKSRSITIHGIEILSEDLPISFKIRANCSKGTYIRTLCADIGEALGSVAHMGYLLRTKSGSFHVEDTIKVNDLKKIAEKGELGKVIMPIENVLDYMPRITISQDADRWMRNGNKIPVGYVNAPASLSHGGEYLAYDAVGGLAGIYVMADDDFIKPKVMLL